MSGAVAGWGSNFGDRARLRGTGSRKGAADLRALKKSLAENPSYLFKTIEENLTQDSRAGLWVLEAGTAVKVAQCKHKSKINQYGTTRWAWSLGGVWQCVAVSHRSR